MPGPISSWPSGARRTAWTPSGLSTWPRPWPSIRRMPPARAMMGLVAYGGHWLTPEKVGEAVKADATMAAKLARYEAKRQATPPTAEAQWQLALWCEKNGLKAEATAHFTAVTLIAPRRTEAWKKLGCELYRGRWIDAEQVAAERADAEAQKKADRHWEAILSRSKKDLVFDSPHRQEAVAALSEITDTRAVPSIQPASSAMAIGSSRRWPSRCSAGSSAPPHPTHWG